MKRNGFLKWVLVLGLAARASAQAVETGYAASGRIGDSKDDLLSARASAMGLAFSGLADDASALFSNPAGLAYFSQTKLSVYSRLETMESFRETGVLGLSLGPMGGMGISGSYLDFGTFTGRDAVGSLAPNYVASDFGLQGGWGVEVLPDLSLGAALRFSREDLAGQSYSYFNSNFGLLFIPAKDFRLGLAYSNVGLGNTPGPMGSTLGLGASLASQIDPSARLLITTQGELKDEAVSDLRIGVEGAYLSKYFLRAGCQASLRPDGLEGFSGLTLGAGIIFGNFNLDYAYLPYSQLGVSHRFDIGYVFDVLEKPVSGAAKDPTRESPPSGSRVQPVSSLSSPPAAGSAPPILLEKNSRSGGVDETKDNLTVHFAVPADFVAQGDAMEVQGRYPEAVQLYRKAIQQNQQNLLAWWRLGNTYQKLNRKASAVQCFESVLRLKPGNRPLQDWLEKYKVSTP